ncbi:hypothetical protein [Ruegeria profundi]|uniref:Uncharacterized protein n=1 Tax=Ruegeria profundi TaxID=1685378 RepID=A0A0X3TRC1_9RHOB|nr:hypothetical protein [Ruegeria profundi]KUJ78272.1 hypothetical protein AVO44_14040 [Ruegeria profundi]
MELINLVALLLAVILTEQGTHMALGTVADCPAPRLSNCVPIGLSSIYNTRATDFSSRSMKVQE